ncbi:MAG TPA: M17 family peptidase N-terminal domain-containing protein [Acidimicrobiales bacterium]|nr:M17 family peptidase N-terminal domain-containing protein [Acidimicrobiales bacterium]
MEAGLTVTLAPGRAEGDVVARGVFSGDDLVVPDAERHRLDLVGFGAKVGQAQLATDADGTVALLVGLGARDRMDPATLRRAAGAMTRAATRIPALATTLIADLEGVVPGPEAAAAIATGALSVRYRFDAHRSRPSTDGPAHIRLVTPEADDPAVVAAVRRATVLARGVALARDLVNEPGGTLTPTELAERIRALASDRLRVVVHDHQAIRALGMGGVLGVNRGSTQPPAFVEVHHEPPRPTGRALALVGKGITYDTGGINLKKLATSLIVMKGDMGGAAAVIGAMSVLADLDVPTRVTAYLPLTDNMTGGDATRPGDVLRMYGGTTVEVVDTDAEGRLVLADAVAYAADHGDADAIVTVATLTGTIVHATGTEYGAVIGREQEVTDAILAAAEGTPDRAWPLPRMAEYRGMLKSTVADLTNRSEAPAASAVAALFVEQFVGDTPWAHIDMNAVNLRDRDTDDGPAGARGWGVHLLVRLAEAYGAEEATS